VSVSICGGLIFGEAYIWRAYSRRFTVYFNFRKAKGKYTLVFRSAFGKLSLLRSMCKKGKYLSTMVLAVIIPLLHWML
jgi:hypothetical protein